jgi:secreted trypsin-like serine protease
MVVCAAMTMPTSAALAGPDDVASDSAGAVAGTMGPDLSRADTGTLVARPRVVGGKNVTISFAPWQVALVRSSASDDFTGQFCGGSIIARDWIATAAHCVSDGTTDMAASEVRILAGSAVLSESSSSSVPVSRVVVHPDYDGISEDHDVALLRLSSPLTLKKRSIEVIELPTSKPTAGSTGRITGWGATWMFDEEGNPVNYYGTPLYPTVLQGTDISVQSDSVCQEELPDGSWNSVTMLCATTPDFMQDTCYGDSGGPLATRVRGRWELSGITSWGVGCAWLSSGVYANVANYRDWIETEILGPGSVPDVSPPVRTADGARFDVLNHDPDFSYRVSLTAGSGRVRVGKVVLGVLPITVTRVSPGASVTIEVTTSQAGHVAQSTTIEATALQTGSRPLLSRPVGTSDGATFAVTNFADAYDYQVSITSGVGDVQFGTAADGALPVIVSGVARGRSVTVRVTTTREGHTTLATSMRVRALK